MSEEYTQAEVALMRWLAWERAWVFGGEAEYPGSAGVVDPRKQVEDLSKELEQAEAARDAYRTALEQVQRLLREADLGVPDATEEATYDALHIVNMVLKDAGA